VDHGELSQFLGTLVVMLSAAKLFGYLAQRVGQPAVLGELVGGVVVGSSVLGWIDPRVPAIHLMSELGVVLLLLLIGLETDLRKLLHVGVSATLVALAGVVLPFACGYAACRLLGLSNLVALMAGASLSATSVGISARVLADLGRLDTAEGRIILGAAVIDDVIGLIILTVVAGVAEGASVSWGSVAWTAVLAVGFIVVTWVVGRLVVPFLMLLAWRIQLPGTSTIMALILAFGLGWLADRSGSAVIIGAFAAGLLLARTPDAEEIEKGITVLGHFFVPLFFVSVGAAVNLRTLNPLDPAQRWVALTGCVLVVVAIAAKFVAGYAPFWFRGDKRVIGVGMIPRGEVGLVFAQVGLSSGVFDQGLFGATTLMVIVTTMITPPLLKHLLAGAPSPTRPAESEGIEDLVMTP
jgi:Kef-type K+ transport system membrane component KefB